MLTVCPENAEVYAFARRMMLARKLRDRLFRLSNEVSPMDHRSRSSGYAFWDRRLLRDSFVILYLNYTTPPPVILNHPQPPEIVDLTRFRDYRQPE